MMKGVRVRRMPRGLVPFFVSVIIMGQYQRNINRRKKHKYKGLHQAECDGQDIGKKLKEKRESLE